MERPPALAGEHVREFVIAGHGDLARVQALLTEQPGLLNAAWDWGGGDFETALAGAAHTGSRDMPATCWRRVRPLPCMRRRCWANSTW